jgi:hypothetical protein
MPPRVLEQSHSEIFGQAIRLRVHQGTDKGPAFLLIDPCQIQPHVAELAFELAQSLLQWVAFPSISARLTFADDQFLGTVGADDHDAAARQRQTLAQMEQQTRRPGVRPLHVVK